VRVAKFLPDKVHLFSGSDDKTVRYWDISSGESISCLRGHTDYVRAGWWNNASPNIIATGGYDHKVLVWDFRTFTPIMNLDHGAPVEALVIFPDGGSIVSAGSNYIKIWDVLSGGRLIHTQSNHQKTITTMFYDASHNRLFTGGLDCLLKIYELPSYNAVHTEKFSAPILSAGISPDRQTLLIGQSDKLSVRRRPDTEADVALNAQRVNRGSIRYFLNSVTTTAPTTQHDLVLNSRTSSQADLSKSDNYLRQFEYKKALNEVLKTTDPLIIVSMLQELENRDGLEIAIAGRDEASLITLLSFLKDNITHPLYSPYLIKICHLVLDVYSYVIGRSPVVEHMLNVINNSIKRELAVQSKLLPLMGTLEFIINSSIAGMPIEQSNENPATPVSPEIR
jgi:U3 small nucleolar RNA-associated protein 15